MAARRKRKRTLTIQIGLLKTDPRAAWLAARRKGGVQVVDERAVELFRLWVPSEPLE